MPPKRRSSSSNTDIIAPGGGTQADVNNLAWNLGMDPSAVLSILNSEGAGIRASRSSAAIAPSNSSGTVNITSAWAEFMTDEGFGTATEADSTKRAKTHDAVTSDTVAPIASTSCAAEDSVHRTYQLPIHPRMHIQAPKSNSSIENEKNMNTELRLPEPGILVQTGTLDVNAINRSKRTISTTSPLPEDLMEPTLLGYVSIFAKVPIALIATSSSACHSIAIDIHGVAYSWGRNEVGQCGLTDTSTCVPLPTKIHIENQGDTLKWVGAAVGKAHSVLVSSTGQAYAVGFNKFGQCGVGSNLEKINTWKKCVFTGAKASKKEVDKNEEGSGSKSVPAKDSNVNVVQVACGENFTVLITSQGHLYSCGLSEFGQLGNGETGEYFVSANKLAFANATKFERRSIFVQSSADALNGGSNEESKTKMVPLADSSTIAIASIACGRNHTIAVEAPSVGNETPRVFSWGCGAYGCLGHGTQTDEYQPRLIATLRGSLFASNTPKRAAAGTTCSMVLTSRGHVYYWGKHRSVGEATMRPSIVDVLANNGHVVVALGAGSGTVVCSTEGGSTVSWGQGPYGELGYGSKGAKSSAKPQFVEKLHDCMVTDVACGYGHTLFIVLNRDSNDQKAWGKLQKIETNDLTAFIKSCASDDGKAKSK